MDFSSKCDKIHSIVQIWSHLLKKSLIENFIFSQWQWDYTKRLKDSKKIRCFGGNSVFGMISITCYFQQYV